MNENIADEIRKTIESIKDLKTQASGINNYLGILEGMIRTDYQKKVDEAYQRGYDKGYADKTNNDEVVKGLAKDIYQRGLNDAWEAARKIVLSPDEGGTSLTDIYVMFGNNGSMQRVFRSYSASEVIEKLKAREKKLSKQPTIQPDIVRCKDCKHRDPEDKKCDCGHDILWQLPRRDDWFCGNAEKKEVTE